MAKLVYTFHAEGVMKYYPKCYYKMELISLHLTQKVDNISVVVYVCVVDMCGSTSSSLFFSSSWILSITCRSHCI